MRGVSPQVKNWVRELRKMLGGDVCLTIVGNKTDLEKQRAVPVAEAEAYAASVGATHLQTSAKLSRGIEELFLDLSKRERHTLLFLGVLLARHARFVF